MPPAPADLLPWAAGPAAIYLATSALAPWLARWAAAHPYRLIRWWQSLPLGQILQALLQFGFYVGIPYTGLVTGALDLRSLGLAGADLPVTLALSALVATVSLALYAGARRYWAPAAEDAAAAPAPAPAPAPAALEPPAPAPAALEPPAPSATTWQLLTEAAAAAVALQAHLALYSAALLPAAGADLAPFAALALLALERIAGAILAGRWDTPGAARSDVEALATSTAGAFVLWGANSLPGAMAVHVAVAFGLTRLRAR
jgi:hypothetical protein